MRTALITHEACLGHETPPGHPERAERLRAVLAALKAPEFADVARVEAPRAEIAMLERAHTRAHIDAVFAAVPAKGRTPLDADTSVSPGSGEAALRAAGAVVKAVDMVVAREAEAVFCAVRPPGHHAEPDAAMGFCLFNNVAVGALHALKAHGLSRVAVMDFDVHHGNGTQAMFWDRDDALYLSTHQSPLYPGTGRPSERGAKGMIVNAPLPPGAGGVQFRAAMEGVILRAIDAFRPELIFISAGFDGHGSDPLAGLNLTETDFAWATAELAARARAHAKGRVVSTLEGGYDLDALARSAAAHMRALMEA